MKFPRIPCVCVMLVIFAAVASAQWSSNAATNFAVGNRPNDQAVPKLAATQDGGCWVSWFDHGGSNYDVYIQKLDANGFEIFPHNGLLVSNNPQNTSLVDWDLICDSAGNAVLAFTDTRAGGDLDVYAYQISPSGQLLWGPNGVTLSNDSDFEANPVIAEMTDGSFVFAWTRSITGSPGRLGVQKLDANGVPQFGPNGIEVTGVGNESPGSASVVAAPNGGYILSWFRDVTAFLSPRHLYTQMYDASGVAQWGPSPVIVYNAAALPIGFKNELMSDGAGGAWYSWHVSVGSFFQGRVQHISAAGAEVFPHNGVEISLEASRSEFNPSMAPLAGTGDIIVFYNKRNSGQSLWGIGGQRITSTGQLAWGSSGIEFVPYDAITEEVPRAVPCSNGAMCFVEQGNFTTIMLGFRVDANGNLVWAPTAMTVSSTVSPKDKLRAVAASDGTAILAWSDSRTDPNDIYVQNVELDGSLGIAPAATTPYGCGYNPAGSLLAVGSTPSIGTTFTVGVTDPAGSMASGSSSVLVVAAAPAPGFPCGIPVGGTGMSSPGAVGELLVDLGTSILPILSGPTWTAPASPSTFPFPLPAAPFLIGVTVEMQGALIEAGGRIGLSNGLHVRIGL